MWTSSVSDSGHFLCGFWVISTLSCSLLKLMLFLGTATGFSPCNPLSALKERFPAQAEPQQPSVSTGRIKTYYWQSNAQLKIRQVIELIILFSVTAEMFSIEWSIDCSYVQLFCYRDNVPLHSKASETFSQKLIQTFQHNFDQSGGECEKHVFFCCCLEELSRTFSFSRGGDFAGWRRW